MSDIFDHELDAYQQYYDSEVFWYEPVSWRRGRTFRYDRLYYHHWFGPVTVVEYAERQLLLTYEGKTVWVPRSIIARIETPRVLAHRRTFLKIFKDKDDLLAGFDEINKED